MKHKGSALEYGFSGHSSTGTGARNIHRVCGRKHVHPIPPEPSLKVNVMLERTTRLIAAGVVVCVRLWLGEAIESHTDRPSEADDVCTEVDAGVNLACCFGESAASDHA